MSEFTAANSDAVADACRENLAAIGQSIDQCFGGKCQLTAGDAVDLSAAPLSEAFQSAGVVLSVTVNGQALVALIPQTLPLPDWYRKPGDSERSRLQTLAMECSLNLLPGDLEAAAFATTDFDNLAATLSAAAPADWAKRLDLSVFAAGAPVAGAEPLAVIPVIWPVTNLAALEPVAVPQPVAAPQPAVAQKPAAAPPPRPADPSAGKLSPTGLDRILKLPVTVIVHLAEKKIELGQLLALTPGALVTFNKSCEALLDLYVNNVVYCRGEAVKIGENFGLKVNQMGAATEREERVL